MNWAPSLSLLTLLVFNMQHVSSERLYCHNSRRPFIQTATGNDECFTYLFIFCIFSVPSTFSHRSILMASPSISRSPSVLLLMLIFLPVRLLLLLSLLVPITVIFSFVVLTFVTHVFVATFVVVVMYHFFGDTCTFSISVMHMVVYGLGVIHCTIISSCCLGLVRLLL